MVEINYGCKLSSIDLRDYKIQSTENNYPDTFCLDKVMKVKDQGSVGACVAFATSSILEYYAYYEDMKQVDLSTEFIYGIQNKLCKTSGPGMSFRESCEIVKKCGDMLQDDCPGNHECPICYSYAEQAYADRKKRNNALNYKIESYYDCPDINSIKHALMNYGPVLAAMKFYSQYYLDIYKTYYPYESCTDFGYHAIVIIG